MPAHLRSPHVALCALAGLVFACGARSAVDGDPDAGAVPTDAAPSDAAAGDTGLDPDAAPACVTRSTPFVPVESGPLGQGVYPPDTLDRGPDGPAIDTAYGLDLLVGEGYPTVFTASAAWRYYGGCGELNGALQFTRVEVDGEAVTARLEGGTSLVLEVRAAGEATVVLRGTYSAPDTDQDACAEDFPPGSVTPVVERVRVRAIAPTAVEWLRPYACGDGPMKVVGGAFIDALVPAPVDAAGEPFYPVNAESGRWLRFDTEACAYGALAWPESPAGPGAPAGTQFPMGPARVTLTADVGAPLVAQVQAPGEIDAAEVVFAVAGFGGGPVPLTDGETLGDQGWGRTARRIFPSVLGLTSAGVPVCGAPPPEWFVFTAAPPEVCAPRPLATEGDIDPSVRYGLPGPYLGVSAYLVADGTCDLSLTAPAFAAGAGFEARLSATLLNVENMHDAP
jgi:hypothetical protein